MRRIGGDVYGITQEEFDDLPTILTLDDKHISLYACQEMSRAQALKFKWDWRAADAAAASTLETMRRRCYRQAEAADLSRHM